MRFFSVLPSGTVKLLVLLLFIVNTSNAFGEIKKIRVGIYQNYPLAGQNTNGEPQGLFVEVLNEIAPQEGWEIDFIPDTFSNCLKRLENQELDLVAAVAHTEQRDQYLDFSKETVCTLWGTVYVQPNSEIQTIPDLDGKLIAIMSKGIFGQTFKKLCRDFNIKPHFVETESQSDSLELLKTKKVDAATFNNAFKELFTEPDIKRTSITYNPLKISFAFKEGENHEVLRAIDNAMHKWKKDEQSFYFKELQRWLGTIEVPQKFIPQWLIYALLGSAGIIIIFFTWLVILRRQIKQRKIAEESLQDSENRFRSLSDAAFEGIIISDNGKIIDVNNTLATMFGYSTTELVGMKAIDLACPEDRDEVQNKILSGYDKPYKVNGMKKDGTIFPLEVHARMFSFKGKQVRVTASRDLTELQKAEEEIKNLRGILPICSYCKKIRNDKGAWDIIEAYICSHSEAEFSHSVCPECYEKHMED